jgi:hypothetical protein
MTDGSVMNIYIQPNVEYVNPVNSFFETTMGMSIHLNVQNFKLSKRFKIFEEVAQKHNIDLESKIHKSAFEKAITQTNRMYSEITAAPIPEDFFELLTKTKKRVHEKIVNKIKMLDPLSLQHFIFSAYENYQFLYSTFRTDNLSKNLNPNEMPSAAILENGKSIISTGNTLLSDGQLKMAIEQRNVIITKIIDKGDQWHCFFYTQNSILGKEHHGYKHIHYISHSFGITREEVVKQLKSKRYNLPAINIPYNYRPE